MKAKFRNISNSSEIDFIALAPQVHLIIFLIYLMLAINMSRCFCLLTK